MRAVTPSMGERGVESRVLFARGENGYHTFRIPSAAVTTQGTLLVFAEGRRHTASDTGEIEIVLRRSFDYGRTFSELSVVVAEPKMTCGNAAPVVDRKTGKVWLLFCKNREDGPERAIFHGLAPRTVWVTCSEDEGESWSAPEEITECVKPGDWTWYATGPGHGIQLQSGRLLVPCDHARAVNYNHADPVRSHVIFSDDAGRTWQLGGIVETPASSECGLVELGDGTVVVEFRLDTAERCRGVALSGDGGVTFDAPRFVTAPPDPGCRGGVCVFYRHAAEELLVSHLSSKEERERLILRANTLGTLQQTHSLLIWPGPAAYSELLRIGHELHCVFEAGVIHPYETIRIAQIGQLGSVLKSG